MTQQTPARAKSVEPLFPFALRARILLVGKETLRRSKSRLHFVLVTTNLSDRGREEVLSEYAHYPVVQRYTSADLERLFGLRGTKVLGFRKSHLAQSIYRELKGSRLNKPAQGVSG